MASEESEEWTAPGQAEIEAVNQAFIIFSPMILLLGTVGNSWNIVMATRFGLRNSPTSSYIIAMSLMDFLVIWSGLGRHFVASLTGVDIRESSPAACKSHMFILFVAMDASAHILVAISAERFVAVCLAHRRKRLSRKTAIVIVAALTIASALFNLHILWTRGEETYVDSITNATTTARTCGYPRPELKKYWSNYQGWVAMTYFSIVPFVVMAIMNAFIIRKLRLLHKTAAAGGKVYSSLTVMLLCGSLFFLCITAPASTYRSIISAADHFEQSQEAKEQHEITVAYTTLLHYLNHAISFYIYVLTGKGFRREVAMVIASFLACKSSQGNEEVYETIDDSHLTKTTVSVTATPNDAPELVQTHSLLVMDSIQIAAAPT